MSVTSEATTLWFGDLTSGSGTTSLDSSDAAEFPVTWAARSEGVPGKTNPEELLGAAHSACFSMALSLILGEAGLKADSMTTTAKVTLSQVEGGYAITDVALTLNAKVPGANAATFQELAAKAKAGCPVSKVLNANITLEATLANG